MCRRYRGGALLTQHSCCVSSAGDLRLGACSDTIPFYIQAKHLQILVPYWECGSHVPRTVGNDDVCFRLPR